MKKLLTLLLIATVGINYLSGQNNTFPTTGNAGVKTTAPATDFQINGVLSIGGGATTNAVNLLKIIPDNTATYNHRLVFGDNTAAKFNIGRSTTTGVVTDLFTVLNNGNIGIGTNNPSYKIDAVGNTFHFGPHTNTATNTQLNISSGVAGSSWVNFGHYNTFDATLWRVGRTGSDQSFRISNWGSGAEVNNLTISQNGNIGIGTATPAVKLEVKDLPTVGLLTSKFTTGNSDNNFNLG